MFSTPVKLTDGYAISGSYTSPFMNLANFDAFCITAVFTGGAPIGTLSLELSNSEKWSGMGDIKPRWQSDSSFVSDVATVPSGTGNAIVSVNGAGNYVLNQYLAGYLWVRVKYTAQVSSSTTLDIFASLKGSS